MSENGMSKGAWLPPLVVNQPPTGSSACVV